jgi:hypothetical protein
MIEVEVCKSGLEFDEVSSTLSGPLRQKLIEKLVDIASEYGFWNASNRSGELGDRKEFELPDDQLLNQILAFCKTRQFIQVSQNV